MDGVEAGRAGGVGSGELTVRSLALPDAAVAAYAQDDDGPGMSAYGIMVLTVDGDHITEITGFADPALFPVFELPIQREM